MAGFLYWTRGFEWILREGKDGKGSRQRHPRLSDRLESVP